MSKINMDDNYRVLATKRIDKQEFEMKVSVLHFGEPVNRRRYRYVPTLLEVEYKPLVHCRRSFAIKGYSEQCYKKKLHFGGHATGTTSFPLKKRYVIKVPCDLVSESQRIIIHIEVYRNVSTHKGIVSELYVKHQLED